MYYGEHEPDLRLKPFVAAYWQFRVPDGAEELTHTVPPDGGVTLSFGVRQGGFAIVGPRLVPFQPLVRGGDHFWGIRFWPGAASSVLHVSAAELRDLEGPALPHVPASWLIALTETLVDRSDEGAVLAALDEAMVTAVGSARPLDQAVMDAVFAILHTGGNIRVGQLAERAGLSERQLRRRFRNEVGLSPKELIRVRRVRASIIGAIAAAPEPWVALAHEHGYADQPHLAREFKALVGLAPEELRAYLGRIAHGDYQR